MNAREIAEQLQLLYQTSLPNVVEQGSHLIESLPPKQPPLAHLGFGSTAQRLFILLHDICESFQARLGTGYFTTAALTRSLMETATVLVLLNRDATGRTLSAYFDKAEKDARKRRDGLAKMRNASATIVANAAKNETAIADRLLQAFNSVRATAALPTASKPFPDMAERCRMIGENWQFMYHATYRDLCEAVQGAFQKIPHAPSVAFQSPNQGAALIHEHCKAYGYAVEFWGFAVFDSCTSHPDQSAVTQFRVHMEDLISKDAAIVGKFPPDAMKHTISF